MRVYKVLSRVFLVIAVFLVGMTCAMVGYEYSEMKWAGIYLGWSAPPSMAFIYAIPGSVGVAICLGLAWFLWKKTKSE